MQTPWGPSQDVQTFIDGVIFVATAGHGGFNLSPDQNAKVHPAWRIAGAWYEEDCEAAIAVLTFKEAFKPHQVEEAHKIAKDYFPREYQTVFNVTIPLAESWKLRREDFDRRTINSFVVTCASGDWHSEVPPGSVHVYAKRKSDNLERCFYVPNEEYGNRGEMSFIIDEARHIQALPLKEAA